MSEFYKADDDILYILFNSVYYPIACLTSNSFQESSDLIDSTTRDNAGWKTSRPTNQSYNISFEGIETLSGDVSGSVTYNNLTGFKTNRTLISFRVGSTKIIEGQGYISNLSKESPAGDLVSFSGTIEGYGQYSEYDPSLNNVFNYDLNFNL